MIINIKDMTDYYFIYRACEITSGKWPSRDDLVEDLYRAEHSPIRTQMFWVEMLDIPTYVSTHFVRHKIGVEHYVQSNRGKEADRNTPINHAMFLNAQALINMARKRLCNKADKKTVEVMRAIKEKLQILDPVMAKYLVPECVYRGGVCHEIVKCDREVYQN